MQVYNPPPLQFFEILSPGIVESENFFLHILQGAYGELDILDLFAVHKIVSEYAKSI
jgi:hypothetical protein